MFRITFFFVCVCSAFGLPVEQPVLQLADHELPHAHHPAQITPIVSEEFENTGNGNFHFGFVSGDGTKVQEEGTLRVYDEKNAEEVVRGSYEYVSPEGRNIKVEYFADGTGFHAFSNDIPKSAGVASPSEYASYVNENQRAIYNPVARSFPATEQSIGEIPVQKFQQDQVFNYPANAYNVQN